MFLLTIYFQLLPTFSLCLDHLLSIVKLLCEVFDSLDLSIVKIEHQLFLFIDFLPNCVWQLQNVHQSVYISDSLRVRVAGPWLPNY